MTYETMVQFKNELVNLYSKERLKGYDSLAQHDENLNFIGIISPKIAKIEIALRNMLDFAHRYKLRNYELVNASLNLFLTLRNRCFHWENLRKTKQLNTITLPRIYTTIKGVFISLDYDKIESFLDDIGNNINENLLDR